MISADTAFLFFSLNFCACIFMPWAHMFYEKPASSTEPHCPPCSRHVTSSLHVVYPVLAALCDSRERSVPVSSRLFGGALWLEIDANTSSFSWILGISTHVFWLWGQALSTHETLLQIVVHHYCHF